MKFFESTSIRALIVLSGIVVIALGSFLVGQAVGYRKAVYSSKVADNYYRVFTPEGAPSFVPQTEFSNSHGAVGRVLAVIPPLIVVADNDNTEKTVRILPTTLIRKYRDAAEQDDLSVGEHVIVLGMPDDTGVIDASLIRIVPAAESASR